MKDSHFSYDLVAARPVAIRKESGKQFFLISLLIATWLPIAIFLSVPQTGAPFSLAAIKLVILYVGTAHVPATIYFYIDRGFYEVIRNHKIRYVYLPIAVTLLSGLVFAFSPTGVQSYVLLIFWAWQAFHYGRQNLGVYAFASIAQKGRSPHKAEKLAIDLGTACGIFGTFKILGLGVAPNYLHQSFNYLYLLGTLCYAGVFIFSVYVYVKYFSDATVLKTLFFFTSVFFFFPVFISTELSVAFLSYAMAHGFQYLVFMMAISLNSNDGEASKRVQYFNAAKLVAIVAVVALLFTGAGWFKEMEATKNSAILMRLGDFLIGAILGTTMAHFLIDAGAWKLSMALQRSYITRRFNFLFNQGKIEGAAVPERS